MNTRTAGIWNLILIAVIFAVPFQPAQAGMISTEQVALDAKIHADREKIRAFVSRADAERGLKALGVKPELAKQRVDALTDQEVVTIAGKIDTPPAGGNIGNLDSRLLVLLAAIIAIVLIL